MTLERRSAEEWAKTWYRDWIHSSEADASPAIQSLIHALHAFAAQETAALQTEILRIQQVALSRTTPEHIQEWTEIAQLTRERDALQQRVEALELALENQGEMLKVAKAALRGGGGGVMPNEPYREA